ncbi:hypothetical protein FH972_010928 [Carpinus fangiana]|uniref:Myb/SANT-like DNA-binding domain-containing protein n=1 Tax=Carpinus fangiana TaxID=176857 RepID=A0A660KSV2_9ROSI|nr:hypothetical protein FH972_010928 [Carpinus fangiana]
MASASPPTTTTATNSAFKKPQPLPWTHEETVHLIQAYQEKLTAVRRGQLKSSQWEEVAVTVSARCGYDHTEPSSKSALQCRHKIEKLRQRYRSESQRSGPHSWPYFHLMDSLERGPLPPISARPISHIPPPHDHDSDHEDDSDRRNRLQSIDYILRRPSVVNRFSGKRRREELAHADDCGDEEEGGTGRGLVSELAAEIRAFAERFIGMENLKMEVMKDTERFRMEMENKRIELILESQRRIVDSIERTFGSP